jgi:hypothetical protein
MLGRPRQFQSKRRDLRVGPALSNRKNPGQNHINEQVRLSLGGLDVEELYRSFLGLSMHTNFLWTRQLFVSAKPLQSVGECTAAHDRNGGRVRTLESRLRAQPQAGSWIGRHFTNSLPKREQFRRSNVNLFLLEKSGRQLCSPQ